VATEAKPFASLSSGLLARKGAARPAMRPQGFGGQVGNGLEDLGWNDMGFEPPKPAEASRDESHDAFGDDVVEHPHAHPTGLTPVHSPIHSPVHTQQAEIADRFAADADEVDADEADVAGADEGDEEEIDETAEPFDPEAEAEADPVAEATPIASIVPMAKPVAIAAPAPRRSPRPRAAAGSKAKAAFTLRLDPERHLKLRLACAVGGRSAQQLVTDALDQLLERMPDLDGLAAKAKRRG
jgi:hypothetical protein